MLNHTPAALFFIFCGIPPADEQQQHNDIVFTGCISKSCCILQLNAVLAYLASVQVLGQRCLAGWYAAVLPDQCVQYMTIHAYQ